MKSLLPQIPNPPEYPTAFNDIKLALPQMTFFFLIEFSARHYSRHKMIFLVPRTICEISSKSTIRASENCQWYISFDVGVFTATLNTLLIFETF